MGCDNATLCVPQAVILKPNDRPWSIAGRRPSQDGFEASVAVYASSKYDMVITSGKDEQENIPLRLEIAMIN